MSRRHRAESFIRQDTGCVINEKEEETMKALRIISLLIVLALSVIAFAEEAPAAVNLLVNPSFEETQDPGLNEGDTFPGWTYETDAESWSVLFSDGPAYAGDLAGATWCADPFNFSVIQTIAIEAAGTYTASAWIALGEATFGDAELRIVAEDGTVVASAALPAVEANTNTEYQNIVIEEFALEAGTYQFVVFVPCTAVGNNSFFRVDGAFLGLK